MTVYYSSPCFSVAFCGSLFVPLSLIFWQLYFFYLRFLIISSLPYVYCLSLIYVLKELLYILKHRQNDNSSSTHLSIFHSSSTPSKASTQYKISNQNLQKKTYRWIGDEFHHLFVCNSSDIAEVCPKKHSTELY